MLCVECGGTPDRAATTRRRVKMRPTGDPQRPLVVVCDWCGRDVEPADVADGRVSDPEKALKLFGMHPEAPPLLHPGA